MVRAKLRAAWTDPTHPDALASLQALAGQLQKIHPGAAGSLREGMEETLTLTRLGVTGALRRTLSSTNPIESMFDTVRTTDSAGSGCVNAMQEDEEETAVVAFGCAGAGKRS